MKEKLLDIIDLSKSVPKSNAEKKNKSDKHGKSSIWNKHGKSSILNNPLHIENENRIILKNINLHICERETIGLIGPTGCGKTSLLRMMNMLDKPSSGKILYKGEDVYKSKNSLEMRRNIAMVFQKPIVFKGTVSDNIIYGLKVRNMEKEVSSEDISNILEKVGLGGYNNQKASTLSGGEIQRVAFARALIIKPKILLLDEPTANLDPGTTEKIGKLIQDIRENEDTAIVIATHNLILGQKLCDEIAIIDKKIFQFGKTEDLFKKPENKFVAEFVGMGNIQKGVVTKREGNLTSIESNHLNILSRCNFEKGREVYIGTRPEDITVSKERVDGENNSNQFKGKMLDYHYNGALVDLKIDIGEQFSVYLTKKSFLDLKVNIGSDIWIQFKPESVHLFEYK